MNKSSLYIFVTLSVIILSNISVTGQKLPIMATDTIKLKRGIYMSYDEFLRNNPSSEVGFKIEEKIRMYETWYKHVQYVLIINDEGESKVLKNKSVWGFCDGNNVYIAGVRGLTSKTVFEKIIVVGKLCAYEKWGFMNSTMYTGTGPASSSNSVSKIAFEIQTGEEFKLYKKKMYELLAPYPDLLAQYKKEKKKTILYFDYIKLLNKQIS